MSRLYFLACVILTACLVSGQTVVQYGVHGKMLHLNPGITNQPENMLWKHNGNKVVEFDGTEEEVFSQFQNRVTLDWISAELNITDLRYDDGGEYDLEVYTKNKLKNFKYKVVVIDKISKPNISCDINNGSSGTHGTQATLTCSADSQPSVTYQWDSEEKVLQGPKLTISLGEEHDDKVHTCIVSNHLNSESVTFTAKDCYPAKISSVALSAGIAVAVVLAVLLVVVLGVLYMKRKKTEVKRKVSDIEASQGDERNNLIDRTPTVPSTQRLDYPNQGFVKERKKIFEEKPENLNKEKRAPPQIAKEPIIHLLSKDDEEADESIREPPENMVPEYEPSDTEKTNEPAPGVLDHREDTQADVESSAASEQPEENKKTSPPIPPKKPARLDPVNQSVNNNDAEADEPRAPPENKCEPEPAGVSDHSEDTQADVESPTAPQRAVRPDQSKDTKDDVVPSTASENPEKHLDKDKKTCRPSPPKKPAYLDPLNQPGNNKENAEKDESTGPSENKVPESERSDTKKANEPDTQVDVESPTAPQRGYVMRVSRRFGKQAGSVKEHTTTVSQHPSENKVTECEPSDREKANESDPAGELNHRGDTQAEEESPTAPQQGYVMRVSRRFGKQAGSVKEHKTTVSQHPSENKVTECEPSDREKANESDPAGELNHRGDTQAEEESSAAPEQPESDKSHPANGTPPVSKPRSCSTNGSPDVGTKDTAGEHKEGTKSDPVNGETEEND